MLEPLSFWRINPWWTPSKKNPKIWQTAIPHLTKLCRRESLRLMKRFCVVFLVLLVGRHACLPPTGLVLYHRACDIDQNDLESGRTADGCAFRALFSVDLSQPLFPEPHITVAAPASPAVPPSSRPYPGPLNGRCWYPHSQARLEKDKVYTKS